MNMVNIRKFKSRIIARFPNDPIADILLNEPDEIPPEELIGKISTWESIMVAGKRH
jgi:hypothetical protein